MRLRYTPSALREIDNAIAYIGARSPQGAQHVASRFYKIIELLRQQPEAGAIHRKPNTRRLFLTPYPYAIYYRVSQDEIIILRFRHTSRRR
ncbi:type II toxin-antitoxin system RelE/ParE family toxin [Aliirhizobium terrae]|uniref:type II toxin-antitoxin system RelE/ParE family toxin n=1 Tax=Terrirhizobium terrae TaxID=2926709 RepID=UPI00257755FA|nr:type II toxin-antitoxin system RelE/ParE family toxin [Rhizobium sp. CC-CFT758]WJH40177.1 type II toxin-antitoxin system RelE/ParE family toxin [Rhizobium sp. CC-CFT758]